MRGAEWVSLSDGRVLCLECVSSIVVDTKDAQPLYDEVLAFFRSMGWVHGLGGRLTKEGLTWGLLEQTNLDIAPPPPSFLLSY